MMMKKRKIGIIGLGKMGGSLALQALDKGYAVAGFDHSDKKDLAKHGVQLVGSTRELVEEVTVPRIILVYVPAGPAVDDVLSELCDFMNKGDVVVDGGNSYWGDSIRRTARMHARGFYLIDCGTSGGMEGARHGTCFMAGGEDEAIHIAGPFLRDLAVENGFLHTGPPGSGHFVKLVHNGIEFGMLQAIGEGMALLSHYKDELDIKAILSVWNHGSVIRSWLIDLMKQTYGEHGSDSVPSYIEDTGEVNWLITDALQMEVAVPVIAQSIMQLIASRDSFHTAHKAVAMMRHGFGGHPYGADEAIRQERRTGRVGVWPSAAAGDGEA